MKFFHLTDDLNFFIRRPELTEFKLIRGLVEVPFCVILVLESHPTHENDLAGYSEVAPKDGTNVMKLEKDLAIANNSKEDNVVMQHNSNVYIRLTFSSWVLFCSSSTVTTTSPSEVMPVK